MRPDYSPRGYNQVIKMLFSPGKRQDTRMTEKSCTRNNFHPDCHMSTSLWWAYGNIFDLEMELQSPQSIPCPLSVNLFLDSFDDVLIKRLESSLGLKILRHGQSFFSDKIFGCPGQSEFTVFNLIEIK